MISTRRILRGAGVGCVLSLVACAAPEDVANLGVYIERSAAEDAGATRDAAASTELSDASTPPVQQDGGNHDAEAPVDAASGPACARTGCISPAAVTPSDPALHCHDIIVTAGDSPPLPPGILPDRYVGFDQPAPVQGQQYLRSIAPIIDDVKHLHHMKLYESPTVPNGPSPGSEPPKRRLLHAWIPGDPSLYLDPSVGIPVAENTTYSLEIHYVGEGQQVFDRSGFQVCYTPTAPEYLVSLSGLKAKGPPDGPATGKCAPATTRPITLLSALPNLASHGRHVKIALQRQGGREEVLFDHPYDHEISRSRELDAQLLPGDTLTTRCDYTPPAFPIDSECEVQVLHWPAHTLVSGGDAEQTSWLESCAQ